MPVKKTTTRKCATAATSTPPTISSQTPDHHEGCMHQCQTHKSCHMHHHNHHELMTKIFATLFGILLVYIIFLVGTMIRNNMQRYFVIGHAPVQEQTITLEATGKVTAKPNIAMTTIGMTETSSTVIAAQKQNTKVMNDLISKLKALGVDSKDIQTQNYNIYPQYSYTKDKGKQLIGYQVSQNIIVKIRNLDKANDVLALAGQVGANTISGLKFTIDNTDVYQKEARDAALKKVFIKANALSKTLGIHFGRIVSYTESGVPVNPPGIYSERIAFGVGGRVSPNIQSGSNDVVMQVRVTYDVN